MTMECRNRDEKLFVAFCVLTHFNAAQHYKYRIGLLKQNDILNQVYGEVLGG